MIEGRQILESISSVLVVDWPSRDVPDTLVRAGHTVVVHGGPGPEDYAAYQLDAGEVVVRPPGRAPEHVDLVYSHRPIEDLPGIVTLAQKIGARAIWSQSGLAGAGARDPKGCWVPEEESREARALVESAGLAYVEEPYIADAVRQLPGAM
jgi:predicted CoA-binding protein